MLKLIIGNKAYSSWSLRGWLAVKQSGLPFEVFDWQQAAKDYRASMGVKEPKAPKAPKGKK